MARSPLPLATNGDEELIKWSHGEMRISTRIVFVYVSVHQDAGSQGFGIPCYCSFFCLNLSYSSFLYIQWFNLVILPLLDQEPLKVEYLTSDSESEELISSDLNKAGIQGLWVSQD